MADAINNAVFEELLLFLQPALDAIEQPQARRALLREVGWDLFALKGDDADKLFDKLEGLPDAIEKLGEWFADPDRKWGSFGDLKVLGERLIELCKICVAIYQAANELDVEGAEHFAGDLLNYLIIVWLDEYHPLVHDLLALAMLIDDYEYGPLEREEDADASAPGGEDAPDWRDAVKEAISVGTALAKAIRDHGEDNGTDKAETEQLRDWRTPGVERALLLGRVVDLMSDPGAFLRKQYLPSTFDEDGADYLAERLFPRLASLLSNFGATAWCGVPPVQVLDATTGEPVSLESVLGAEGARRALRVLAVSVPVPAESVQTSVTLLSVYEPAADGTIARGLALSAEGAFGWSAEGDWGQFAIAIDGDLPDLLLVMREDASVDRLDLVDGVGGATLTVAASIGDDADTASAADATSGTRLRPGRLKLQSTAELRAAAADFGFQAVLADTALVISPGDADSFLASLLPADGVTVSFDLGIEWTKSGGIRVMGGLGFEVVIPINLDIGGVLQIQSVDLGLYAGTDVADGAPGLRASAGVSFGLTLGILELSVASIGIRTKLAVDPLRFGLAFKPPTGIGVALGTDQVGGGGFLDIDEERGQYSGMLALSLAGLADITAIALIDTKLPDGSDGWSFLGLLFATFDPGIQLGFGFTLLGVGGLFAFNKGLDTDALMDLYNAGRIDNLMFPDDPIGNAPALIADLRDIFPTAEGRFVFGPMVKMGFGTPTIIEAELGILVSLPAPVVIVLLGELSIYLPVREAPIAELHIDVLGFLDMGKKVFFLGGALRDSRLLTFELTGSMAFRLSWDGETDFAFSIGGFHPDFTPPPDFPPMQRIGCSLGLGDFARLEQQQYLALTPNTFQIGSHIELTAELAGFGVRAWAGFDALLYFQPFHFQADFGAGVELRWGGSVIASLDIDGHLSGPNPFHLWGKVKISLFFWDISVPIDLEFGEREDEIAPTETPALAMQAELENVDNWSTERGDGGVTVELLAEDGEAPILDPGGSLRFLQRRIPLNTRLERFAEADLKEPVTLSLGAAADRLLTQPFPPASYRKMSDAARLSLARPFVDAPAGMVLQDEDIASGTISSFEVGWDEEANDAAPAAAVDSVLLRQRKVVARVSTPTWKGRLAEADNILRSAS